MSKADLEQLLKHLDDINNILWKYIPDASQNVFEAEELFWLDIYKRFEGIENSIENVRVKTN